MALTDWISTRWFRQCIHLQDFRWIQQNPNSVQPIIYWSIHVVSLNINPRRPYDSLTLQSTITQYLFDLLASNYYMYYTCRHIYGLLKSSPVKHPVIVVNQIGNINPAQPKYIKETSDPFRIGPRILYLYSLLKYEGEDIM